MIHQNVKAVRERKADGTVVYYRSITEAAKATGYSRSAIGKYCNSGKEHVFFKTGSVFCFVNDWCKKTVQEQAK